MAWGFCIARAYADEVIRRGVPVDEFAGRLSYNFNIFGNLFEQVAKFRAGRGLWAKIMKQEYGATQPGSMWLRMIAGGGGGGLTLEQPENNIVRGAYYALIAALSGAQTMALCCYERAYTIPSEHAQRISLRTMQLLLEEMGLAETADPLGGSFYVETLTNQMRAEMERIIAQTDAAGGIVKLVADGTIQSRVSAQAYACSARSSPVPSPRLASIVIAARPKKNMRSKCTPTGPTTRVRRSPRCSRCATNVTRWRWPARCNASRPMRARAST
jgi:methylmalonyl-CoA mutase N-terminal domain/subunit